MAPRRPDAGAGDAAPARRAAILAGGAATRMGGAKATVEIARRPLASYPLAAAKRAGLLPVIVAKADTELPGLGCPVLSEPAEPRHPLAGIVAALEHFGEPLVVTACDLPLVPAELLAELAARRARFAMPVVPRPQPLVARYTPGLLPSLRSALARSAPLTATAEALGGDHLEAAELRGYGDPEEMFSNVNSPADVTRVATLLAEGR